MQPSPLRIALLLGALATAAAAADAIAYPTDSGVLDLKRDYGAVGDGETDDTAALQRAISENVGRARILYLPVGTYRVTDTLDYGPACRYLALHGAGREASVIRLDPRCPGYDDPEAPKAVVSMRAAQQDDRVYGNAFDLSIRDLAIEVGAGNPGAVALRWMANNVGALQRVDIRSLDPAGAGAIGIALSHRAPGPYLARDVRIEGFDYGIDNRTRNYCQLFEHLHLRGQRVAGIRIDRDHVVLRGLRSDNAVPAIRQTTEDAWLVLDDAELVGGGPAAAAIENKGRMLLRDVRTSGYGLSVRSLDPAMASIAETEIPLYATTSAFAPLGGPLRTLRLPVEEAPPAEPGDPADWVRVEIVGQERPFKNRTRYVVDDIAGPLQAAIDRAAAEGRRTVYLPNVAPPGIESYAYLTRTVRVHGSVRNLLGLGNVVEISDPVRATTGAALELDPDLAGATLRIQGFNFRPIGGEFPYTLIADHSDATVVLADLDMGCGLAYRAYTANRLFIENCAGSGFHLHPGQRVWARQINPEGKGVGVDNRGADFWALSLKTERANIAVRTTAGGRSEVLGGLLTPSIDPLPQGMPAYEVVDASASLSFAFHGGLDRGTQYRTLVRATRDGETREVTFWDEAPQFKEGCGFLELCAVLPPEAAPEPDLGGLLEERYEGITKGSKLEHLRAHESFPDRPAGRRIAQHAAEYHAGRADIEFGTRFTGAVVPPVTGDYVFLLEASYAAELRLGEAPGATPERVVLGTTAQKADRIESGPVTLEAGVAYPLELLHQHMYYPSRLVLGWRRPDGVVEMPIPARHLEPTR
jgi:hypothetical protein